MKIYVASSWGNKEVVRYVVDRCRALGHDVYDFTDSEGFHWSDVDPNYKSGWYRDDWLQYLNHPLAQRGFNRDAGAIDECDALIMVQPCGASAHLELGYAVGLGKKTAIIVGRIAQPELMYKFADFISDSILEVLEWLDGRA